GDREQERSGKRTALLGLPELLRHLDAREGIADANATADQLLEPRGEPGKMRRPAGENDLADAKRSGLVLVELKRRDELAREDLNRSPDRVSRPRRLFRRQTLRRHLVHQRQRALDVLDLGRRRAERP